MVFSRTEYPLRGRNISSSHRHIVHNSEDARVEGMGLYRCKEDNGGFVQRLNKLNGKKFMFLQYRFLMNLP